MMLLRPCELPHITIAVPTSGSGTSSSSQAFTMLWHTALRAAAGGLGGLLPAPSVLSSRAENLSLGRGERLRHHQVPDADLVSRVL